MGATPPPIPDGYEVARTLLGPGDIAEHVERMAGTMQAGLAGLAGDAVLVGIRRGGVHLAERLAARLAAEGLRVPLGMLDISLYRDDLHRIGPNPIVGPSSIPVDIDGATVVLVDDVLYTGRTIRAALDALLDYGRPRRVMLAVLVDRGHRELPIRPDFVGKNLPSARSERVNVHLAETDGIEEVTIAS